MLDMTDNLKDNSLLMTPEELKELVAFVSAHPDLDVDDQLPMFNLSKKHGYETASVIRERKVKYGKGWDEAERLYRDGGIVEDPTPNNPDGKGTEPYLERYLGPNGLLEHKGWGSDTLEQMRKQTKALVDRIASVSKQLGKDDLCTALVVGHVQSGKTANFCADINKWMDMVSSFGKGEAKYSTFIILTSNNTALGTQTEERLRNDVIRVSDFLATFKNDSQKVTENVRKYGGLLPFRTDAELLKCADLETRNIVKANPVFPIPMDHPKCVIAVAIKNKNTIPTLTTYLKSIPNLKEGGVVIIDDEADVITPTRMRNGDAAKTRQALLDMIDTIKKQGRPITYVAFTATPYASVLNQFPSKEANPLYPHIVQVLKPSDEYFGSARILGGLREKASGQVQIIPEDIKSTFKKGKLPDSLPDSLKEAFAWFLCTVCARRCRKAEEPVSMLIHIARDVHTHSRICELLQDFVQHGGETLIEICKKKWEGPLRNAYTKNDIPYNYPAREIDEYDIAWEDIEVKLRELVREQTTKETEPDRFTRGLNFRIVNSKYKRQTEDFHYPTTDEIEKGPPEDRAPKDVAMVAIGGDRIARGLTLEGLTTSYFAREAKYGDSLLQYARWQGYRRGYEVLPRVWMTKDLLACFKEAAWMEQATRSKLIEEFNDNVDHWKRPVTVAVCRKAKLKPSGKMQDAQAAMESNSTIDTSYIGDDPSAWRKVFDETERFVSDIGSISSDDKGNPVIWRNVPGGKVLEYLRRVKEQYANSGGFVDWQYYNEDIIAQSTWNVCFIPLKGMSKAECSTGDFFKGRPMRTVKPKNKSPLYIKTVRANKNADDIVDVPEDQKKSQSKDNEDNDTKIDNDKVKRILAKSGLDKTPLLRIYLHAAMDNNGEPYLRGKIEGDEIPINPIILLSIAAHRLPGQDRDRKLYHVNPAALYIDSAAVKSLIERSIFELDLHANNDDDDRRDAEYNGPCVRCKFVPKDTSTNNTPDTATILKGSRLTARMISWLKDRVGKLSTKPVLETKPDATDDGGCNNDVEVLLENVVVQKCLASKLAKGLLGEESKNYLREDCDKWIVADDDDSGDRNDDLAGETLYSLLERGKEE